MTTMVRRRSSLYVPRASGGGGTGGPGVAGMIAWYSAEAETSYANGAVVTRWTDQSGNGNHATGTSIGVKPFPVWQSATGPAGGPAIYFNQDNCFFDLPNMMAGKPSGEVFVNIKSGGGFAVPCHWGFGAGSGSDDECHYPYSNGAVYESFGLPQGSRPSFFPTVDITQWRTYNVSAAETLWDAFLDGVNQFHAAGGPFNITWTPTPILGRGMKFSGGDQFFYGWMSSFLLFNRTLNSTERATVNAWMTANPSGGTP